MEKALPLNLPDRKTMKYSVHRCQLNSNLITNVSCLSNRLLQHEVILMDFALIAEYIDTSSLDSL